MVVTCILVLCHWSQADLIPRTLLLLQGWDQGILGAEGIPAMKPGGKRRLVIPSELAYGAAPTILLPPFCRRCHRRAVMVACVCALLLNCAARQAYTCCQCHTRLLQGHAAPAVSSLPTPRWQVGGSLLCLFHYRPGGQHRLWNGF